MVMFDLSGTTVHDDTGVRDCLYQAVQEFKLATTPKEILYHVGTNKLHLYQFLSVRARGKQIAIEDFEKIKDPESSPQAKAVLDRYQTLMLKDYRRQCKEANFPAGPGGFRQLEEEAI